MQSVWKFDTYWLYKHRVNSVQSLKESPFPWYRPHCTMELPFSSIHNKGLQIHLNYSSDSNHPKPVPKKETRIQINSLKSFVKWAKYLRNLKIHLAVIMMNDKLEKMKINKQQDLSIVHLKSTYHWFENLQPYIWYYISENRISTKHLQNNHFRPTRFQNWTNSNWILCWRDFDLYLSKPLM